MFIPVYSVHFLVVPHTEPSPHEPYQLENHAPELLVTFSQKLFTVPVKQTSFC